MMGNPKVGSLFSGIGGIDLAFEQSGFEIAWANEINASACKVYRDNFPTTNLIEGDIRDIDPQDLEDIDVLAAGFPCQPFSIMGYKRGFKDPRGNLFFEISRFIDAKRPKVVFFENVRNLVRHDDGKTFLVIYNTLAQFGYSVKYKVINATEANIPQERSRIFIVAFLNIEDCDHFAFPNSLPLTSDIEDILNRKEKHSDVYYYGHDSRYYNELNARIIDKTGIYRIDDSGIATHKWDVCPTLKANMGTYPDRVPIIRDDYGIRKLTPRECLTFQGFPESFIMKGISLADAYRLCGNTVCVPVVKKIAETINKTIESN